MSLREAALFELVDDKFVRVIERASLHHVASVAWANGKAGILHATSWSHIERLVIERGVLRFNDAVGLDEDKKFTTPPLILVNLSMLMVGFANAGLRCDALCARVASDIPDCLHAMHRHEFMENDHVAVVNLAWSYAKLEYASPALFAELSKSAVQLMSQFSSQNVANLAWAFATAKVAAPDLFGALALHSTPRASEFTEQGLSMTLWAYATSGVQAPRLFAACARVARHRIQTYSEQGLTNTIWAFGKAGVEAPELFEAGLRTALPNIGSWMAAHVSQLCQGLASSTFRAPIAARLVAAICDHGRILAEHGDAQSIVVTLHSVASMDMALPGPFAVQQVHALLLKEPDARHLTQAAWALVTSADVGGVGSSLGMLLDKISAHALGMVDAFNNKDCTLMDWTLWKGYCEHGRGFTSDAEQCVLALAVRASTVLGDLTDHDLANLATVFGSSVDLSAPPDLVRGLPMEVFGRQAAMTGQHLMACVRFLARNGAPRELWAAIEETYVRKHMSFDPQAAVSVVWSFATAGAAAWQLHRVLGDSPMLDRLLEKPRAQWLANLAWACATSKVGLPAIFQPVSDAAVSLLKRAPGEFKVAELSSLMWAVATAGFHVHAKELYEAAFEFLSGQELEQPCDGQSVCNLLWAWAVGDMRQHRSLLRKLHRWFVSLEQQGDVTRAGMAQAHQYQLWVEHELADSSLLFGASLRQHCCDAMEVTHASIHVSGFQSHVARGLRQLGLPYQVEYNIAGYSVDLALPTHRIALEVDGPHHYLYDLAPGDGELTIENARIIAVNGSSTLKARLMRAMGWHPVSIPFYEFEALKDVLNPSAVTPEHLRYLGAKLSSAHARV